MVKWTREARQDLQHIFTFLARDSVHYAKQVTHDIVEKSDVLNELPRVGRTVPELGDENVRELGLYSYRIIYEIIGQEIFILAVVHKRREFQPQDIGK